LWVLGKQGDGALATGAGELVRVERFAGHEPQDVVEGFDPSRGDKEAGRYAQHIAKMEVAAHDVASVCP
jgi:hypothetical protein